MSVAKIIEISSESTVGFEDAINRGITKAHETIKGIHGAWVKEQKVTIKDGKIVSYRVNLQVTFVIE
jgi:flavin-binding protein dodecin